MFVKPASDSKILSVVVVNWRTPDLTIQCAHSLERQDLSDWSLEVIVIENGSRDGSLERISAACPTAILLENAENYGFAKANNIGIARSQGRYVALVNSDVIVHDGCLKELLDYMEANPQVGLVAPKVLNEDGSLQVSWSPEPSYYGLLLRALALDTAFGWVFGKERSPGLGARIGSGRAAEILSGCFLFARREALQDVGLLDENFFMYGEDKDWCKRFWDSGWTVVYLDATSATHLGGRSSGFMPGVFALALQKATLAYWRKHHGACGRDAAFLSLQTINLRRILIHTLIGYLCRSTESRQRAQTAASSLTSLLGERRT